MKCLSLFSGIGGFDQALVRQGHEIIAACEIDKYARSVYSRHFPKVRIYEDATKINPEELPDFDILVAGFPCQTFSIAGKRLGFEESRGTLFFEIARIAKQKRPRLLLLENVKGLLSHDSGRTFAEILSVLDELGYDAQWQVLNSKYFVPQNRERIFIVGHLREEPRPEVFPIREIDSGNNESRSETQREWKRIQNQLSGTIDANYHKGAGSRTMVYMSQKNSNMKQRIQDRKESWCLTNNSSDFGIIHYIKSDSQANRVYDPKGIAPTLGIGNAMSKPLIKEANIRRLTPLECERLQGFPDEYTKLGKDGEIISDTQRYRMCGNAVTVPVIEYILERIK